MIATINDGQNGSDGDDGHSPVVTATKSGTTTTINVDGNPIATINDGNNGQDGNDGHSPVMTATKSGTVTTISVDGTSIAQINDGTTPVKGTDYWTAQDKAGIVQDVLSALPTATGVSF